jgi:glycosyltransferase involved in cell wall biosynthesis
VRDEFVSGMTTKEIKIAYFIDRLIRGGSELQLTEQIRHLKDRGIYQEVFCLQKSKEHDQLDLQCKVTFLNIRKLASINCIGKILLLAGYLKRQGFNIVQTYFFDSTLIGVTAARIAGGIRVMSWRRDTGFWYTPKLLMALRMANRMTDIVLVNCKAVMQSVVSKENLDPQRIRVIPNGIELAEFVFSDEERARNRVRFGIPDGTVCVGIIANMSREVKRVDVFIRAAAYVLERRNNIRFIVLGDGDLKKDLIELAESLGIAKSLLFLDSSISKWEVLSAIDIGTLTSDSEGLSNAIMEYMASGLPVIATAVGGNTELIQDGKFGLLFKPGDAEELGAKILTLAGDEKKRLEFGERGKEIVSEYGWRERIDAMLEFYKSQLRRGK